MEEIGEKYLPIGTVVMLKGGTKRVMISGFCAIDGENVKNMYDYSGCVYPEGFLTSTQTCLYCERYIFAIQSYVSSIRWAYTKISS